MPSGKASKQQRRATPPPPRSTDRARRASPRVLLAVGGAAVAIAVAVGLAVYLSGGSSSPSLTGVRAVGSLNGALPGAADVQALFKGIPQHGTTLGRSTAPVTLVEFVDAQCPYCQQFETQVAPSIVRDYVRPGKLRIELEPWAFIGPDSVRGQAAELAAAAQNKLFNFSEVLYDNQGEENSGWLTDAMIENIAESVPGLHVRTLMNDRSSSAVKAGQKRVDDLAKADNINQTPTLIVGKTGTKGTVVKMSNATDKASLVAAIEAAGG
jgi:protein-disulfide isomerase